MKEDTLANKMADDFKCHHSKTSTSTVSYHHDGVEFCSEKCFHDCINRKAEHNRLCSKGEIGHQEIHASHSSVHTGKKMLDHHDHGNVITDLNPRFANSDNPGKDVTHDKFSQAKSF